MRGGAGRHAGASVKDEEAPMRSLQFLGRATLVFSLVAVTAMAVMAEDKKEKDEKTEPDVIFVPTPQEVVDKMLETAKVTKDDVVYDLGCGDGRIVCTAARKYGCKAVGFDIDPDRIKDSEANKAKEKKDVQKLITFQKKDIFKVDLSKASVITLYLLPDLNVKLIPQLKKLKAGSRIVSHAFDMRGVKEDKKLVVKTKDDREHDVYLWTIPLKFEKKGRDE
jgi:ribosomal protein L11 methylase PrmA